jgi:hypothetical protein
LIVDLNKAHTTSVFDRKKRCDQPEKRELGVRCRLVTAEQLIHHDTTGGCEQNEDLRARERSSSRAKSTKYFHLTHKLMQHMFVLRLACLPATCSWQCHARLAAVDARPTQTMLGSTA